MLIIRKEQMEALSRYMLKQFEEYMVVHLRSTFPEQTKELTESALRAMIHTGIDKAQMYNITDEVNVERFLEYMVRYGADFDLSPEMSWTSQILDDHNLSETEKMQWIDDYELFVLTEDKG